MRWRALALAQLLVVLPAAAEEPLSAALASPARGEGEPSDTFAGEGRVVAVDAKKSTVTLDHEAIPGLMPAMRMRFPVADGAQLRGLEKGDAVQFRLGSRGDEMVIVAIGKKSSQ
jgi:Cu/Ag efflux protein CusF